MGLGEHDVPSVRSGALTRSYTWASPIPDACVSGTGSKRVPCVLGVDEAGRGPVLGPLVYGVAFCPLDRQQDLRDVGFADSKALTPERRDELLQALLHQDHIGKWCLLIDRLGRMLRRHPNNLNEQSCDATVMLIQGVLSAGVDVTHIYVDTVGDPKAYAAKLKRSFPRYQHIEWTVARKADATYPVVGAASVAAKVTRDYCIERWLYAERNFGPHALGKRKREDAEPGETLDEADSQSVWQTGSGYPGDPKTVQYLKETLDPVFGWAGIVRFSWATAKSMLEEPVRTNASVRTSLLGTPCPPSTRAYAVRWMDEAPPPKAQATLQGFFTKKAPARGLSTSAAASDDAQKSSPLAPEWQEDRKMLQEKRHEMWQRWSLASCSAADLF
ncbi:ribonuclease H [Malassezia caprae]|uniref:Ribonuclease n=1 Tax=Malassezia caprae TaxID=1381934 RepID=A0AAF0ED00_9BASI|nr:ribonuclease H [Malassezia caprae]